MACLIALGNGRAIFSIPRWNHVSGTKRTRSISTGVRQQPGFDPAGAQQAEVMQREDRLAAKFGGGVLGDDEDSERGRLARARARGHGRDGRATNISRFIHDAKSGSLSRYSGRGLG